MEIKELKIYTQNFEEQVQFYKEVLGFSTTKKSEIQFEIQTKKSKLIFESTDKKFYYHFAFLIPPKTIDFAIQFLENKYIELLLYKKSKIIDFKSGKSIYFFDKNRNIVEFIERPSLNYKSTAQFSIEEVIKINEIGLPVAEPIKKAKELVETLGIIPLDINEFSENFC